MTGPGRSYPTEGPVNLRALSKATPAVPTVNDESEAVVPAVSGRHAPVTDIPVDGVDDFSPTDAERAEQRPSLPELAELLPEIDGVGEGPARWGLRGYLNAVTRDLFVLAPRTAERTARAALAAVRQQWVGYQRIMVANPKGGEGCTVCALMMGHVFAEQRGSGRVVVWDNNTTEGTLGSRAALGRTGATVWDLIADAKELARPGIEMAALSGYLRLQPSGAEVLAADDTPTGRGQVTADHDRAVDAVLRRFRDVVIVDTGHNRLRSNWQWTAATAHLLVVPMTYREDSAVAVCRMLAALHEQRRFGLIANAIVVLTDPPAGARGDDRIAIQKALQRQGIRNLVEVPWDPILAGGARIDPTRLSETSRAAWTQVCAMAATSLALSSHMRTTPAGVSGHERPPRPTPRDISGSDVGLDDPLDPDRALLRPPSPATIAPLHRRPRGA